MLSVIKQAAFLLFNCFVPNPLNRPQPIHIHAQPRLTAINSAMHPLNHRHLHPTKANLATPTAPSPLNLTNDKHTQSEVNLLYHSLHRS